MVVAMCGISGRSGFLPAKVQGRLHFRLVIEASAAVPEESAWIETFLRQTINAKATNPFYDPDGGRISMRRYLN